MILLLWPIRSDSLKLLDCVDDTMNSIDFGQDCLRRRLTTDEKGQQILTITVDETIYDALQRIKRYEGASTRDIVNNLLENFALDYYRKHGKPTHVICPKQTTLV